MSAVEQASLVSVHVGNQPDKYESVEQLQCPEESRLEEGVLINTNSWTCLGSISLHRAHLVTTKEIKTRQKLCYGITLGKGTTD